MCAYCECLVVSTGSVPHRGRTEPHTKIPKCVLEDSGKAEVTLLHSILLNVQQPLSKLLIVQVEQRHEELKKR